MARGGVVTGEAQALRRGGKVAGWRPAPTVSWGVRRWLEHKPRQAGAWQTQQGSLRDQARKCVAHSQCSRSKRAARALRNFFCPNQSGAEATHRPARAKGVVRGDASAFLV